MHPPHPQAAQENKAELNDEFFAVLRTLLQSQAVSCCHATDQSLPLAPAAGAANPAALLSSCSRCHGGQHCYAAPTPAVSCPPPLPPMRPPPNGTQFKQATDASAPGNTRVLAAGVLSVFDGAWRAALEARQ